MVYKDLTFDEYADKLFAQIQKGAFMTTKNVNKVNTMTISWGGISHVWNKPVFIAYVRYTRDTYQMVESTNEFTINVPLNNDLSKELGFCGSKSGRDYDKIKECNLKLHNSRVINTPILADCELHYECKVIYKQAMEPGNIQKEVKDSFYKGSNFHVIYYGEIVDTYIIKGEK